MRAMIPRASRCASAGAASGVRIEANADIERQRLSDNGLFPPQLLGLHLVQPGRTSGLQASYTFDWWGKQRDAVEAAMDQAHAARGGAQRRRA